MCRGQARPAWEQTVCGAACNPCMVLSCGRSHAPHSDCEQVFFPALLG